MRIQRYILISSLIGLVLVLAGCDDASEAQAPEPAATSAISVRDNDFDPQAAEVAVGETVTWTWEGDNDHNVVGDDFASDVQADGTFTHTFDRPGTYEYACTLHGGMTGTISVTGGGDGGS